MKILQVIPTLGNGGAEHLVFELSNELCQQGHQVEILTLYDVPKDNALRKSLDNRITVYSLNKKLGFDLRIFFSLRRFVKKHHYDVVHGHVSAIKYLALAAFLSSKVRFVATIHSEACREAGKNIDKWTRRMMFGMNKCIPVTISEESELSFESFYGRKGTLICNGVSDYTKQKEVKLRDNENQIVFLHPARCQPVKNQALLLAAFNRLIEEGYDAKLVWVGSNKSYMDLFNSLAPLMNIKVSYLGVVDNVRDYMASSDAVCLSSKMEGMPMTIIEAFSVGRPVLCTPVGGCLNMIKQGKNGMMSEDLCIDSYYKVLVKYVKFTQEERLRMCANAYASFEFYSIESCATQYLKVYQS